MTGTGCDASALLDGVTILAGVGSDPGFNAGGGLLVIGGSPTFQNCTWRYNAIGYGSSAYLVDCASTFEACVIRDAYTCNCGAGGWTSGVLATGTSDVTFLDCDFVNHYYVSSSNQGRGAALNIDFGASGTVIGCRFLGNQTGNFYPMGGGTAYGAGIDAHGDVVVDRCQFLDNFAHAGAGLTVWADARVTNSLFARNEAVSHPETSAVSVGNYGAGLLTVGFGSHTIEIANCTFLDNNCDKGAGLARYGASVASVRNCVVYDNYADPPAPGEDPIFILKQNLVGNFDIANSDVQGLLQTEPGEDPPNPANFPGCLDTDPLVEDLAGGNYRLSAGSACIDAGDNGALPGDVTTDLDGLARFTDDPATPDTGLGGAPIVDMGAFEFGSEVSPWSDLGQGLAGATGVPVLTGSGALQGGDPVGLSLTNALPGSLAHLVLGISYLGAPLKGGVLVPFPDITVLGLPLDGTGSLVISGTWPTGLPGGLTSYIQYWVTDAAGPKGLSASNGLSATTP